MQYFQVSITRLCIIFSKFGKHRKMPIFFAIYSINNLAFVIVMEHQTPSMSSIIENRLLGTHFETTFIYCFRFFFLIISFKIMFSMFTIQLQHLRKKN